MGERTGSPRADSNTDVALGPNRAACGVRVLGMHRSGTSFLAGSFAAAGCYLGAPGSVMPPRRDNPRGFYERLDVVGLNEDLLADLGSTWMSPPSPQRTEEHRGEMVARIRPVFGTILSEADGAPVVLKDPRMSILLPEWTAVTGELLVDVVVIRNPADVAASLRRRNGFSVHLSLALWEMYTVALLTSLVGRSFVVANFDHLASSRVRRERWVRTIEATLHPANLPLPDFSGFDVASYHHRSTSTDVMTLADPNQLRLWQFVEELEPLQRDFCLPAGLGVWPTSSEALAREVVSLREVSDGTPSPQGGESPGPGDQCEDLHATIANLRSHLRSERVRAAELAGELEAVAALLLDERLRTTELERVNTALGVELLRSRLDEMRATSQSSGSIAPAVEPDDARVKVLEEAVHQLRSALAHSQGRHMDAVGDRVRLLDELLRVQARAAGRPESGSEYR